MPDKNNILVLYDPEKGSIRFEKTLEKINHAKKISRANSVSGAKKMISHETALVIMDIEFPDEKRLDFIKYVKKQFPETLIILFSSHIEIFSTIYRKIFEADFFIDASTDVNEIKKIMNKHIPLATH
jgi:DNA-binding NarL/FixJ family response regulator